MLLENPFRTPDCAQKTFQSSGRISVIGLGGRDRGTYEIGIETLKARLQLPPNPKYIL